MRRVLSFDIGIKNLAYCLFTDASGGGEGLVVEDWSIVNLMDDGTVPAVAMTCTCPVGSATKKLSGGRVCGKVAKYIHPQDEVEAVGTGTGTGTGTVGVSFHPPARTYYCEVHAKSRATLENGRLLPKRSYERSKLNALTREKLEALAKESKVAVPVAPKPTKSTFVDLLVAHFQRVCYAPMGTSSAVSTLNTKNTDLIVLGRNMIRLMDERAATWARPPTHVLVENQISTIASRMMTIQGQLMMYFLMRFPGIVIEFISSKNKLKGFSHTPEPVRLAAMPVPAPDAVKKQQNERYKQHKRDAVVYTNQLLDAHPALTPWKPVLEQMRKKDDLCDCFLQGIWFLRGVTSLPPAIPSPATVGPASDATSSR